MVMKSLLLMLVLGWVEGQTSLKPSASPTPASGWGLPLLWYKQQIPSPQKDPMKCGRGNKRSWVCDPNSLLASGEADQIDKQIENLRQTTGDCKCEKSKKCTGGPHYGGWQAGVAVITNMAALPYQPTAKQKVAAASEFADYIRDESWELGVCNDDLVIFLAWNDRIVFTATGDELSSIVTEGCVDKITDAAKPLLKENKPGKALIQMIGNYSEVLKGRHDCTSSGEVSPTVIGIIVAVIGLVIIVAIVGVCLKSRHSGGGSGGYNAPADHPHHHTPERRHSDTSKHSKESGGGGAEF